MQINQTFKAMDGYKVMKGILNSFNFDSLRMLVARVAFFTIAVCASVLGYQLASAWQMLVGVIIFCSMVAYDLILVPTFPNFVHYVNRLAAIGLSIGLMAYIGIASSAAIVAKIADGEMSVIDEQIAVKKESISQKNSTVAAFIMNDDMSGMGKHNNEVSKLNDELDRLYKEKLSMTEDNGEYSSGYVVAHKWIGEFIGESDTDVVSFYVICLMWFAIISIQTALSAAVHNVPVRRPSLLGAIAVLFEYVTSIRTMKDNFSHGSVKSSNKPDKPASEDTTKKTEPRLSAV